VSHEKLVSLVEQAFSAGPGDPNVPESAHATTEPRVCFHEKQTEQYHLCLGAPGLARGDERRFILRVLDTILGGSSSSRLFQEVRE
jgi:predicted Zn-dependent peptidase